jgi:hypothetical protein
LLDAGLELEDVAGRLAGALDALPERPVEQLVDEAARILRDPVDDPTAVTDILGDASLPENSMARTNMISQTQSSLCQRRNMIRSRFGSARALKTLTMSFIRGLSLFRRSRDKTAARLPRACSKRTHFCPWHQYMKIYSYIIGA